MPDPKQAIDQAMKCLVTGAAGGIGSAIARLLCQRGHAVHLVDLSGQLSELAAELGSHFSLCDLGQPNGIHDLLPEQDPPDTIINSAGKGYMGSFQSIPGTYFEDSFDANFFLPLFIGIAAIKRWRENGVKGNLLTISSVSSYGVHSPSLIAEAASNHALALGMRVLEHEGRKCGIRVGTIWDNIETVGNMPPPEHRKMLRAQDVARRAYDWLQSPQAPRDLLPPRKYRATYGKESRQLIRARMRELAEAGHKFPPPPGVAIVSGASRGLGKDITKRLLINDWRVVAVARSSDYLQLLHDEIHNHNLEVLQGDVSDGSRIHEIVEEVTSRHGRIDLIVNNAATATIGSCLDMSPEAIKREFKVNFFGYYYLTKDCLEYLKKSRGTILNIESVAVIHLHPDTLPYSCAKIAQTAVSEILKDELLPNGIRVLDIFPGGFNSDFYRDAKTIYGEVLPPPAMPVAQVGDAVMELLYGTKSTSTVPESCLEVYSVKGRIKESLRQNLPAPVVSLLKRVGTKRR